MTAQERVFVRDVWSHYKKHGRHELLWRKTRNPYHILISEVMLQQTQVGRVELKYKSFLKQFPTFEVLAKAPLSAVLKEWQGLGYNRRAKMLHDCAKIVVKEYDGRLPKTRLTLISLPGIGEYTSGAVMAFAYNKPEIFIETNIRSVYLHHFFKNKTNVSDAEISRLIERTLDREKPKEWYYALMDYGVYIKQTYKNPNTKSKHYNKQNKFKGSDREIRGAIIRELTRGDASGVQLRKKLPFEAARIDEQSHRLLLEEMIKKRKRFYTLP